MTQSPDEPLSSAIALGLSQTSIAPIAPVARRERASQEPVAPWRQALVLADPRAGHGHGHSIADELRRGLRSRGVGVDLHALRGPGDGRARLATIGRDTDLVVAVGDADTFAEVLSGWPGPEVTLACLPLDGPSERSIGPLRKTLGLARNVDGALETLFGRRTTPFPFLRIGSDAALFGLKITAPDAASPLRLSVGGESRGPRHSLWIERARGRWSRRLDPGLALRLVSRPTRWSRGCPHSESLDGLPIEVDCARPARLWIDGRPAGTTPIELRVETSSRLLVP